MSEKNAYKNFHAHIMRGADRIDRMENAIGEGMPDINYCIEGVEGWIEIKSPIEPKRATTALFGSNHRISQAQMNWFLRQRRAQGVAFLLIETNKRSMLIGASNVDEVNGMTVEQLLCCCLWSASRPIMDAIRWARLRDVLQCNS
jgi:hypothetical protein